MNAYSASRLDALPRDALLELAVLGCVADTKTARRADALNEGAQRVLHRRRPTAVERERVHAVLAERAPQPREDVRPLRHDDDLLSGALGGVEIALVSLGTETDERITNKLTRPVEGDVASPVCRLHSDAPGGQRRRIAEEVLRAAAGVGVGNGRWVLEEQECVFNLVARAGFQQELLEAKGLGISNATEGDHGDGRTGRHSSVV